MDRPGKLILIRHGESEGNLERRFTTSPAAALTELGRRQATEAARRVKSLFAPELVISSPYERALQTAKIIAGELGLALDIEPDLREQSLGELAGQSYDVVMKDPTFDPARSWLWRPPGGESREDVRRRIAPILDRLAAAHPAAEVIVVSHGGVMSAMCAQVTGDWEIVPALWASLTGAWKGARVPPNAGIVVIEHTGARFAHPRPLGW